MKTPTFNESQSPLYFVIYLFFDSLRLLKWYKDLKYYIFTSQKVVQQLLFWL